MLAAWHNSTKRDRVSCSPYSSSSSSLIEVLLQLLVGVVDAQLLEVVLDEDLKTEDVEHADELVGVLPLKNKK